MTKLWPTDFTMKTQLAELSPDGSTIQVEVRAQDFAGAADHGGIRLFDQAGHVVDVPLDFKDSIDNTIGPRDDQWVKKVLVKDLPIGMNALQLQCKSWVDIDQPDGSRYRVWEPRDDVDIQKPKVDKLFTLAREVSKDTSMDTHYAKSANLASGPLTLKIYRFGEMTGSHSVDFHSCIKEIRFEDEQNFFKGATKVQVLLIPRFTHTDRRMTSSELGANNNVYVQRSISDLENKNLVTLTRHPSGTYSATAPKGKSFTDAVSFDYSPYYGDTCQLDGFDVALVDPITGLWDSANGKNYLVTP